MKRCLRLLHVALFLLLALGLQAQLSVLLVDDSDDGFDNTGNLRNALDAIGYTYDLYNAVDAGVGPDAFTMGQYDLVIWHTSNDDFGLHLWNGDDSDNAELLVYLAEGGNLWLIGNDFLFDRYGTAPVTFAENDFPYDFLGISSYDAQAYGDDGGLGVAEVVPAIDSPIPDLVSVDWIFETLWWPDAVTPLDGAVTIFEMGGDTSYPLLGDPTGVWYDNGTSICLSFFFDLSLASSQSIIETNMEAVLDFFEAQLTSTEGAALPAQSFKAFPTLFEEEATIQLDLPETAIVELLVTDALGREVVRLADREKLPAGLHQFRWQAGAHWPEGAYFVRLRVNDKVSVRNLILSR